MDKEPTAPPTEPTRAEEFAKTATAAKLSGTFNETVGRFKRKWGELTDDPALREAGRNQELFGKFHLLVGSLRDVRKAALGKLGRTQVDGQALLRKHGGKFLGVASEFLDDVKKTFFK